MKPDGSHCELPRPPHTTQMLIYCAFFLLFFKMETKQQRKKMYVKNVKSTSTYQKQESHDQTLAHLIKFNSVKFNMCRERESKY